MSHTAKSVLFFAAIACFAVGTFNLPIKINLIGLGLFLWSIGRYSDVT